MRFSPRLFLVPDRCDITSGGDIEEGLLHQFQSHVVQLAVSRANTIFQNHDIVSQIARTSRRAFDPAFGGDSANEDGLYAFAPQHEIEIGSDKGVGAPLLEDDILRLRL